MKADHGWARNLLLTPLLVGALLLTGCTRDEQPQEPDDPAAQVPQVAAADINAQPREALEPGGELRVAVANLPDNWNPLGRDQVGRQQQSLNEALFPRFFVADARGELSPDPNFLLSADVTSNDPTTVSLKLNPKAVWGDGRPVTALDVAATVQACSGAKNASRCASTAGYDQIASVKTGADQFEAIVTYKSTMADWALPFATVGTLRADTVDDPATFDEAYLSLEPRETSGPFNPAGFDDASNTFAAVPNPRWWGDAPMLERITWRAVPPDRQTQLFTDGQIDTFVSTDVPQAASLAENDQAATRTALGPQVRLLQFRTSGALKRGEDRQAVAMALDRQAIATDAVRAIPGWPALVVNNHILALSSPGYTDLTAETDIKPDRAQAAQRLNGRGLQLRMAVPKADPVGAIEAQQIKTQLAEAGVTVDVDQVADVNNALTSGVYDLYVSDVGPTPFPLALDARYGKDQTSNFVGDPDGTLSAALDALRSSEGDARTEATKQAALALWNRMPGVPLYQRPEQVVVRGDLANYGANGPATISWTDVGYLRSE